MNDAVEPLEMSRYRNVVVLTGAGISVASGLRPYRGPAGLWSDPATMALSKAEAVTRDPAGVWQLFGGLRDAARSAAPNAAHDAIARAQRALSARGAALTVITQNVDGLHQRAGTRGVVELHGSVFRTRCHRAGCTLAPYEDAARPSDAAPRCPVCESPLRPDVVFFDEPIPVDPEWAAKKALRGCDLFLAVGTSGTVSPASNYVRSAEYEGAATVFVNLEPMSPRNPAFQRDVLGRAEQVLPRLLGEWDATPQT